MFGKTQVVVVNSGSSISNEARCFLLGLVVGIVLTCVIMVSVVFG